MTAIRDARREWTAARWRIHWGRWIGQASEATLRRITSELGDTSYEFNVARFELARREALS